MNKPILAIMQNMWVREPARTEAAFAKHGEAFRLKYMETVLFMGCKTGRVLKQVFGEELIRQMVFEETTRKIADNPKTIFPADLEHMGKCVMDHKPKVILTFGKIAEEAVLQLCETQGWGRLQLDYVMPVLIHAHHPASRHIDSPRNLAEAAAKLKLALKEPA